MGGVGDTKGKRVQLLPSRAHGPVRETNTLINQNTCSGTQNQPGEIFLSFKGDIVLPKLEGHKTQRGKQEQKHAREKEQIMCRKAVGLLKHKL